MFSCYVLFSCLLHFIPHQSDLISKPQSFILNLHLHFQLHSLSDCWLSQFQSLDFSKLDLKLLFQHSYFTVSIMNELRRLDVLINLQTESFKELLEEHVSHSLFVLPDLFMVFLLAFCKLLTF